MSLFLFNTLTKKKEEFVPLKKREVTMYTCGPTVYGRPHIGNYSSFLMADLLRRWLEVSGYTVTHVKNITDVGHLTADSTADAAGEDKIEKKAREEKVEPLTIAEMYTEQYLQDEKALNFVEPEFRPRATETIPEMIAIIKQLVKEGFAYETSDGIYFAIESFPGYGKLSGNTLANLGKLQTTPRLRPAGQPSSRMAELPARLRSGGRPASEEGVGIAVKESKKHPADFALWKKCVEENARHVLRWNFETGKRVMGECPTSSAQGGLRGVEDDPKAGFPGWHIECSAMSTKFLGEQIDIHTGGEDNIFPHHECEIAQSECASGKPFVRYWLHKRRVNFANPSGSGQIQKMSKSLGNVLSLSDIEERGFSPLDLRYFFLSGHYRSHTQFSDKGLEDARKARLKIIEWRNDIEMASKSQNHDGVGECIHCFTEAMNDDLNTPEALAAVFDLMTLTRRENMLGDPSLRLFSETLEKVFGCFAEKAISIPQEIEEISAQREQARAAKDFAKSDALRKEAEKRGFSIKDTPQGPRILPL